MHLKNVLIVVKDIALSKAFYKDLFGMNVITDFGSNVIFTEGLVLQEREVWEELIGKRVISYGNSTELYFEENDMDTFIQKLNDGTYNIDYVNPLGKNDIGQRVIRIYDPDGHIIEVKEVMAGM